MSYRVTYTVDSEPTELPDGATVEKISALPVEIGKDSITPFTLEQSEREDYVAFFWVNGQHKWLTADETRHVRDALNELLGESVEEWDGRSEPPADVMETLDREGDRWYRLHNGNWSTWSGATEGVVWGSDPADYAPHTIVRRK